jgi:hypothetical protein
VNECMRVYGQVQKRARGLDGTDPAVNHRKCRDIVKAVRANIRLGVKIRMLQRTRVCERVVRLASMITSFMTCM